MNKEDISDPDVGEVPVQPGSPSSGASGGGDSPADVRGSDPDQVAQDQILAASAEQQGMSKKQRRKAIKQERWYARKVEKRKKEREKKKIKRQHLREAGVQLVNRKQLKTITMATSQCKLRVAIDCSFDEFMTNKDICKFGQQIQYAYSANRRVENPLQLYVTSLASETKTRLESIGDYTNWDVHFTPDSYEDVFAKEDIVYLSSESPNMLADLDDSKVYIIGGLVDHNTQKGLCHQRAMEKGIAHAQLPIGRYLHLQSRKVLAINHVFEILVQWTLTRDWETALFNVIPKRKGLSSLGEENSSADQQKTSTDERTASDKCITSLGKEDASEEKKASTDERTASDKCVSLNTKPMDITINKQEINTVQPESNNILCKEVACDSDTLHLDPGKDSTVDSGSDRATPRAESAMLHVDISKDSAMATGQDSAAPREESNLES